MPHDPVTVLRREDLLNVRFEFINLDLGPEEPRALRRDDVNVDAFVILHLPPQHIAEETFNDGPVVGTLANAEISGPSRLVLKLKAGVTRIPYTLESLLYTEHYESKLSVAEPGPNDTAVEIPSRLILVPEEGGRWAHATAPVTDSESGVTELWHTRLEQPDGELSGMLRAVQSIPGEPGAPTFTVPVREPLREELVAITSGGAQVIEAERLLLSTLGGWLNARYANYEGALPAGTVTREWVHRATMGRDQYVQAVSGGILFPFGHRAYYVEITERKLEPEDEPVSGTAVAYLSTIRYIVVAEPEKSYEVEVNQAGQTVKLNLQMPLKRVRVEPLVTPVLRLRDEDVVVADPGATDLTRTIDPIAFWPRAAGQDAMFEFRLRAEDWDGQTSELSAPLIWMKRSISDQQISDVIMTYERNAARVRPMHGQKVAYVPGTPAAVSVPLDGNPQPRPTKRDTSLETLNVTFGAAIPEAGRISDRFYPVFRQSTVRLPEVEQFTGMEEVRVITFFKPYLEVGMNPNDNPRELFAKLESPFWLELSGERAGGLVTPDIGITGLSRSLGTIAGDVDAAFRGDFNPEAFLSDVAKILGGVLLKRIIPREVGGDGKTMPKLRSRVIYNTNCTEDIGPVDPRAIAKAVLTTLEWEPPLREFGPFRPHANSALSVNAEICVALDVGSNGGSTRFTYTVDGKLANFDMVLFPGADLVIVTFDALTFHTGSGQKVKVDPRIREVQFAGVLEFVNSLQNVLKSDALGTGPNLRVSPLGVLAEFNLAIPSIGVGVFSLQNIRLSTALNLPLTGEPLRLRFGFCERHNPFLVTVGLFGGGGFFGLALGLDGIEMLEAALEFGASVSLNLGVASGSACIMAGIYYKMEQNTCNLTAYLRCSGELEVLRIISLSVEFYLSLTYDFVRKKLWGQATITVKIKIIFFSKSVSLTVERQFAGSAGDPTFSQMVSPEDWVTYAGAFGSDA